MFLVRLTVADLERIEIVQGPSSSLYGSEALAGVINLITRKPDASGLHGHFEVRYETHNTVDLTASAEVNHARVGARFLVNRYSSGGFKAPTFQQLYMNFTNPVGGYSVLGAIGIDECVLHVLIDGSSFRSSFA